MKVQLACGNPELQVFIKHRSNHRRHGIEPTWFNVSSELSKDERSFPMNCKYILKITQLWVIEMTV